MITTKNLAFCFPKNLRIQRRNVQQVSSCRIHQSLTPPRRTNIISLASTVTSYKITTIQNVASFTTLTKMDDRKPPPAAAAAASGKHRRDDKNKNNKKNKRKYDRDHKFIKNKKQAKEVLARRANFDADVDETDRPPHLGSFANAEARKQFGISKEPRVVLDESQKTLKRKVALFL